MGTSALAVSVTLIFFWIIAATIIHNVFGTTATIIFSGIYTAVIVIGCFILDRTYPDV